MQARTYSAVLDGTKTVRTRIPGQSNVLDEFRATSESGRALLDQLANHLR